MRCVDIPTLPRQGWRLGKPGAANTKGNMHMSVNEEYEQEQYDIRELREAVDRGKASAKEAEGLRREMAFMKAGVDTNSPLGKMFAKSYDGKLDAEKVAEAWQEISPVTSTEPEPTPEPLPDAAQLEETATRRNLTAGGASDTPNEPLPEDPVARGYEAFHERMQGGERRETAAGAVISSLLQGAADGDERAIWTGWTEEQLSK